jgi:hypothetical protein
MVSAARLQAFADGVGVVADLADIEHGGRRMNAGAGSSNLLSGGAWSLIHRARISGGPAPPAI